jgi:hypothetical protein
MINLYSLNNEMELLMIKGLLEAEGINCFVKNENFGSMEAGRQMALFNKRIIMVQDNQLEMVPEQKKYLGNKKKEEIL